MNRFGSCFGQHPYVVGRERQFNQSAIRIICLLRTEHAGSDADAQFLAQRVLRSELFRGTLHIGGYRFFDRLNVLEPALAWEWFERDLAPQRAEEISQTICRPTEDFEWFKVDRAVGNLRDQGPQLIIPLDQVD